MIQIVAKLTIEYEVGTCLSGRCMCPVIWLMVLAFWRLGTRLYTVSSILGAAEISGLGLSELQSLSLHR